MLRRKKKKRMLKRAVYTAVIAVMLSATAGNVVITAEAENSTVMQNAPEESRRERNIHIVIEEPETIAPIDESTVTVIETPEETVSEPETSAAETQHIEPETSTSAAKLVQLSSSDEQMLLRIAMAEAEDQDTKGMALVMRVVLNRVASKEWPNSVEGVIFQSGQFEPVSNGRYQKVSPDSRCREALDMVLAGWDESQGAEYFCMAGSSRWHENNLKRLFQYKDHVFYK